MPLDLADRLLRIFPLFALALALAACAPIPGPDGEAGPSAEHAAPAPESPRVDVTALQALLEEEAAAIRGAPAIHVRLETGEEAGIRADRPVPAASVIKLPLMAAVLAARESGDFSLSAEDEERVRKMITVSDNPAANALIRRLGIERVNAWLKENGYGETEVRREVTTRRAENDNVTSARDVTRMLIEIARGELGSESASREMREILLAQTRRTRIPAGLPPEAATGNKTGTLRGLIHDAALVEPPGGGPQYALAVLIEDAAPDAAASKSIARLSRRVYEFLAAGAAEN